MDGPKFSDFQKHYKTKSEKRAKREKREKREKKRKSVDKSNMGGQLSIRYFHF